jgi:hypothetical protein
VPPFRHGFGEQGVSERLFNTTVDELTQFDLKQTVCNSVRLD